MVGNRTGYSRGKLKKNPDDLVFAVYKPDQ